ncbi:MAG TPA: capsid cement protein, partial [Pirellulaceae bacterium]
MTALISRETKTFTNSGAIGPYIRVTLSAGVLAIAGATDPGIGVMETRALAADLTGTVRLRRKGDTIRMTAGGAIAQYAKVYPAASGKIDDVASGAALGIALEAASGDGSVIEVLSMDDAIRCVGGQATTVAASDTIVTGLGTLISAVACLDDSP